MLGEQISLIVLTCIHPVISRGRCMIILWQKIINVGYLVRFNIPNLFLFTYFIITLKEERLQKGFSQLAPTDSLPSFYNRMTRV